MHANNEIQFVSRYLLGIEEGRCPSWPQAPNTSRPRLFRMNTSMPACRTIGLKGQTRRGPMDAESDFPEID